MIILSEHFGDTHMKHLLSLVLLSSLLLSNQEINFEDTLLEGLDEVSEIATKTKLNIDDTPSFVTVLHSNKLRSLGIDNVFEALGLVPGVQLKREASGVPVVIFRGVSQKGEVKLMLDGVTINNAYRGSIYHYLDLPIEMVQRIEVIRGAGSVLYGSGAISGVINIITKSSDTDAKNALFVSGGTYNNHRAGGLVTTNIGEFKLSLDAYYQGNEKEIDETDRHLTDYSVGVNLSNEHFTLLSRAKKSENGNAYGVLGTNDTNREQFDNTNSSFFTQLSYKDTLSRENSIELLAGYTQYGQMIEANHASAGTINLKYKEYSYYAQADLISESLANNKLLLGTKFESSKTIESTISLGSPISDPDLKRDTLSLYLNDTYSIHSDLDISAGLRYDNYSDFGDAFSPNLGLVYRFNEKLRFKALYSHAFRAPSWVEITSRADTTVELEAEKSNSLETGIVFKNDQTNTLRINLYATQIKNMITKDGSSYVQNSENHFYGSELEYIYTPNTQTDISLIASYIEAKDEDENDLVDVANIVGYASLNYKLSNTGFGFGSLLKYVSSSKRSITDTRDSMPYSLVFDETISYNYKEFTASLIVKDLFDKGTDYALPQNTLDNDFNDGGRSFLLKASMEF